MHSNIRTFEPDPNDGPYEEAEDLILTYGHKVAREMAMSGHQEADTAGEIEKANYYLLVSRLIDIDARDRRSVP